MIRSKTIKITLCILLYVPIATAAKKQKDLGNKHSKLVNDSIVENLSCDALTEEKILKAVKKERLLVDFNIPIQNWAFRSGGMQLAGCWSLSHTQRLMFYLAQYDQPQQQIDIPKILDLIRGSEPYASENAVSEKVLNNYEIFSVDGKDMNINSRFWDKLRSGINRSIGNGNYLQQNFQSEIEHWQVKRFLNPANLRLIAGNGARSKKDDRKTLEAILVGLRENLLPMIILRPIRNSQHVVLVKTVNKMSNGDFNFKVYDSNQPQQDQELIYKEESGHFFAPGIVNGLPGVTHPNIPLGVFITGDNEFKLIKKTLFNYYRVLCR